MLSSHTTLTFQDSTKEVMAATAMLTRHRMAVARSVLAAILSKPSSKIRIAQGAPVWRGRGM